MHQGLFQNARIVPLFFQEFTRYGGIPFSNPGHDPPGLTNRRNKRYNTINGRLQATGKANAKASNYSLNPGQAPVAYYWTGHIEHDHLVFDGSYGLGTTKN